MVTRAGCNATFTQRQARQQLQCPTASLSAGEAAIERMETGLKELVSVLVPSPVGSSGYSHVQTNHLFFALQYIPSHHIQQEPET